ncbi:sigma-70 family RNA polymerase sigma factor [bacterium]|nr:sigma-70 family RNA polymerase sigma factor [bacterium]
MQDAELMERVKAGDESAFKMIVDRHHRAIYHLCYRYLEKREDAEEVAQDVFIRLYRSVDTYQPFAKLTTFLYRIAVNLSLNRIRDRKRKRWISLEMLRQNKGMEFEASSRDHPDFALELKEKQIQICRAIESLPENQKTAVILYRFQELSYEEIAEVMDCSVSAVEARLHRAKLSLKKKLNHLVDDLK